MSFDAATDRRLNLPPHMRGVGKPATIFEPVNDVRPEPKSSGIDTQILMGAKIRVFDHENGWALVQADADGYVGYIRVDEIYDNVPSPTHRVTAPRTIIYPSADMKRHSVGTASMGSLVHVKNFTETRGMLYAELPDGNAMVANHLCPIDRFQTDHVSVAEILIHTPYLWGGASAFGIDCSGLVQLCFAMCGRNVLRDTDMQEATIGKPVTKTDLRHGDLIFWKGHVAMYRGDGTIIHANGHTMSVAIEGLDEAITRISYLYGEPTGFIRPNI
jgi:cell wall-associated NlpC family hydrolase